MSGSLDGEGGEVATQTELAGDGEARQGFVDEADAPLSREAQALVAKKEDLDSQLAQILARIGSAEAEADSLRDTMRRQRDSKTAEVELIKEKEAQIAAALSEGEKLSVRLAAAEADHRKARSLFNEAAKSHKSIVDQIPLTREELKQTNEALKSLESSNRANAEARDAAQRRLRELTSETTSRAGAQASLEAARAQLETLKKSHNAAMDAQGFQLRSEAQERLELLHAKIANRQSDLQGTTDELKAQLTQISDNANLLEERLKREVLDLKSRANILNRRNEELAAAVPNATKPLVRQLESLRTALAEQDRASEAAGKARLDRIRQAESSLAAAGERDRSIVSRIQALTEESEVLATAAELGREKVQVLKGQLNDVEQKVATNQLKYAQQENRENQALREFLQECSDRKVEIRREQKDLLDAQGVLERKEETLRLELDRAERELSSSEETLRSKERAMKAEASESPAQFFDLGRTRTTNHLDEDALTFRDGMYGRRMMDSTLRQKDEEISALQASLERKAKLSDQLATQLLELSKRRQTVLERKEENPNLENELRVTQKRHGALEQLYAERVKYLGELQGDFNEVKSMYKEQITDLISRIEAAKQVK